MAADKVVCTLQMTEGHARLGVHVLPYAFRTRVLAALAMRWPATGDLLTDAVAHLTVDGMVTRKCRDVMGSLDVLRDSTSFYTVMRRRQTVAMGRAVPLSVVPHPLLVQDACSMYASAVLAFLETPAHRAEAMAAAAGFGAASLPDACAKCGLQDPWCLSSHRPTCKNGKLRRVAVDGPDGAAVAWCCRCYAEPGSVLF